MEHSKRQDWCLEVCEKILPISRQLLEYLVPAVQLGENVLRDSVAQRLELLEFQAYIHAAAMMWVVCFHQLRALTNSTVVELHPSELNAVYEKLWGVGTTLQGDDPLCILEVRG